MIAGFWNEKIRPPIEKRPGIALGIVGALVVLAWMFAVGSFSGDGSSVADATSYYTTDDGKTLFKDLSPHNPPFQHDGGEAVGVCFIPGRPIGKTASIWYLTKYTEQRKKELDDAAANAGPPRSGVASAQPPSPFAGILIKRPGETAWLSMDDPQAAPILKLPDGK